MSFSGDTFTRLFSWVVNAGNGIKIRSDYMDQDTNDIANGLTTVAGRITTLSTASLKQDGGGNVGIGGTAAGWVGTIGLQAPGDVALAAPFNTHLVSNAYSVSGTWKYLTTGGASRVTTAQGITSTFSAASGTAGNNISWITGLVQDISGNVGVGVNPSAWNAALRALELQNGAALVAGSTASIYMGLNWYYSSTTSQDTYKAAGAATRYSQIGGVHGWEVAAAGSAGATITFTRAMTLDNGGNLLIGTATSPYASAGRKVVSIQGSTDSLLAFQGTGDYAWSDTAGNKFEIAATGATKPIVFVTNGAPRLTIAASGAATFTGSATTVPNRLGNTSGAVTLDCSKSNVFTMTLVGNMTSLAVTNLTDGQTINVIVTQDGTGNRTWAGLTSANGFLWAGGAVGVLSTPGGSRDILCLTFDSVAGKFFCTLAKAFA